MRLGQLERRVLAAILEVRDGPKEYRNRRMRWGRRPGRVMVYYDREGLRGQILGHNREEEGE